MRQICKIWPSVIRIIVGCTLIGLITFVCYRLKLNFSVAGFIYLIVIVLQSLAGSFVSSAVVSVVAVLSLDFFFTAPLFSLEVTNPLDIMALVSFLITGLVITQLTTQVHNEAAVSDHQRRQVDRLYQLAQELLALDPETTTCAAVTELFRDIFAPQSVCLFDAATGEIHCTGNPPNSLAEQTKSLYASGIDCEDAASGVLFRCLHAGGNAIGAISFEGLRDPELTTGPLSALAAAILERTRTFRNASHVKAAAQAESFRGAILDALAHEFKTPLATIVTAAGGLRELGPLCPEQLELTEIVETEASRLSLLTSRLLRTAQLDRDEVKPKLKFTNMAELVTVVTDQYSRHSTDRKLSVRNEGSDAGVMADPDLLQLALRQLLDNACKYSIPGSTVTISMNSRDEWVVIRTSNGGSRIRPNERSLVFERFYRGTEVRHKAPGSGLGLYVARKIVHAHGGSLDLEMATTLHPETTFRLALPRADARNCPGACPVGSDSFEKIAS